MPQVFSWLAGVETEPAPPLEAEGRRLPEEDDMVETVEMVGYTEADVGSTIVRVVV